MQKQGGVSHMKPFLQNLCGSYHGCLEAGFGHFAVHQFLSVLSPRGPVWASLDHSPKCLWPVEISLYVGSSCGMQVAFHTITYAIRETWYFITVVMTTWPGTLPAPKWRKPKQSHPSLPKATFFSPWCHQGQNCRFKTFIYLNIFPDPSPHSP